VVLDCGEVPVIDDWILSILWAAWMSVGTMPIGVMLGAPCSQCCGCGLYPESDPKDEGTWVPSGTWRPTSPGVTWTFVPNPGDESGETWFFYGSATTSRNGGSATSDERRDWGNLCNWYSSKLTAPNDTFLIGGNPEFPVGVNKRATRLPPSTAVVHIYSEVSTVNVGPVTVKNAYFWEGGSGAGRLLAGSEITTTAPAHDSVGGAVFGFGTSATFSQGGSAAPGTIINGGATFNGGSTTGATLSGVAVFNGSSRNLFDGVVTQGAVFHQSSSNRGTVNNGATFNDSASNSNSNLPTALCFVNGGATFNNNSSNTGGARVNGGAIFNGTSRNTNSFTTVNDGAIFNDNSSNSQNVNGGATFNGNSENLPGAVVNGGAIFNDSALNNGTAAIVNDGATFNGNSENRGRVNGGATYNDNSVHGIEASVPGHATFNDAACSQQVIGSFAACPGPSQRFFVVSGGTFTCNGTAPDGCANIADTCGCG